MSANRIDLDAILVEIGELGRYQIAQYCMLCALVIFTSTPYLSYIFTSGPLEYRCRIPEIDSANSDGRITYAPDWLPSAVPFTPDGQPERCGRYLSVEADSRTDYAHLSCVSSVCFNRSQVDRCDEFVFATDEVTIVSAFNVTCAENDWRLAIVGTLGGIATLIALPVCAVISDNYGRRPIVIGTVLLAGISGYIKSSSTSYAMFASMEFITSLVSGGTYMTIYVMAIEFAGPSRRVFSATLISVVYSLSQALTGLLAMCFPDFRTFLRVLFGPYFVALAIAIWQLPESVRWLLVNNQVRRARQILLRSAAVNGKQLSPTLFASLHQRIETPAMSQADVEKTVHGRPAGPNAFVLTIRSRSLLLRLANCLFNWFSIAFIYYGMSVHSTTLAGNKYVNYMLVSLVEVPSVLVASVLMARFGRRRVLSVCLLANGLACVAIEFVAGAGAVATMAVYVAGKCGVTVSFTVLYVLSSELFPTAVRHSSMNACSTFGAIGAMLSPMTPLLAHTWTVLPLLLFGGSALLSSLLVLLLPETSNTTLPDTVRQAEALNQRTTVNAN